MSAWRLAAAVPAHAQRLADRLPDRVDAIELLTGRAALLCLPAPGRISAGGASRLLPTRDGWIALTLSRADDIAAVPALVEADRVDADPWPALADWSAHRTATEAVARARLLGLPAAVPGETAPTTPVIRPLGRPAPPRPLRDLLVVELASMWAGPLCGRLLAQAGATVVKVESPARPDGTRAGPPPFFDWTNAGKLSYASDLADDAVRALLAVADVVIEGSRPAALARRGLAAEQVPARDGRIWLRITGYGAAGEFADRVAFGDDAAVAGGLLGDGPVFLGDAIADPLTGLQAAVCVAEAAARGGGELIELAMAAVAAGYAALPPDGVDDVGLRAPRLTDRAAPLGRDNAAVRDLIESRSHIC
ncbi:CoA transferase [Mycolicibacterium sp. F2034L]|uniref:CoA transferase n=1 Tax=Mycolicibacterium sp. F2034L TaxID=2926422 RepID=UPI001FF53CF3|nr:CoA transferase [Mycolicibacterium sp. F2034L]MCK0177169.1 CoA transferase [Mycolicibacterium sp. F2034L]